MRDLPPARIIFGVCSIIGFCLLLARWIYSGNAAGFFVTLIMASLFLLRWRVPELRFTIVIDVALCVVIYPLALVLPMFWAMYYRVYFMVLAAIYVFAVWDFTGALYALLGGLAGLFLGLWEQEYRKVLSTRDTEVVRFYHLQSMQADLVTATAQIERMTAVSERARIAREIHDNAGHEIIAAYISLQAVRAGLTGEAQSTLDLFDAALQRLDSGTDRIREAVHNLAPVTALGVETLQAVCARFPAAPIQFNAFGDTNHVPIFVWNTLETCLNEALTNAVRHARPNTVTVTLDTTPRLIRLCIENDGLDAYTTNKHMGVGLRNLRYRAAAIGGSLAIDPGEVFKVICVIPIKEENP
ncbi:MAG: histidine kinase [Defluviitaleaceae bacterium]|nr:histidine kinase [Defluviitaleaceae bacterium]MCL2275087.1 histidine kinase [Defluviitaleaceae bacterium]